ncbi:MAG: phosphoribosylglycinamide formyltransferase, partial [Oscillospiraceae bacterium]|nr:phosphoribosylglycinamide formyltransferase [Oscillospiraceae bacterium]
MLRVAAFVSGGGTNLQAIIDAQAAGTIRDAKVELVISNVSTAYALERAKNAGIKTAVIRKKDFENAAQWEDALVKELKENRIDLIVLAGFMSILSENFIKQFPNKIINVHPSLIPSFCGEGMYGLHVHEAALAKGVKVTGATVHYVNEIVDGGEIIAQKAVEVLRGDTSETLQKRVMEKAEWIILPRAIQTIAEDIALGNIIANTRCISEGDMKNKAREIAGIKVAT